MSAPAAPHAATEWISGDDTGVSSTAIWRHMQGLDPVAGPFGRFGFYPHDPDDFGRCYRLLALIPAWRARVGEMAQYPGWAGLAREWDALTALYESEIDTSKPRHRGMAPKLYDRMRTLIEEDAR